MIITAATTTILTLFITKNHKTLFPEGTLRVQLIQDRKLLMADPEIQSTSPDSYL